MCRLFGWTSAEPLSAAAALGADLPRLAELSRVHGDGWGVAWVDASGEVHRVRDSEAAYRTPTFEPTMLSAVGVAGIVHLRYATDGIVCSLHNSHPFVREGLVFAHNGAVDRGPALDALIDDDLLEEVRGDTDSERYFLAVVSAIRRTDSVPKALVDVVGALPETAWSSLNAMVLDGSALHVVSRHHPERRPEWAAPDYYDLSYAAGDDGVTTVWSQGVRARAGLPLREGHLLLADGVSGELGVEPI